MGCGRMGEVLVDGDGGAEADMPSDWSSFGEAHGFIPPLSASPFL